MLYMNKHLCRIDEAGFPVDVVNVKYSLDAYDVKTLLDEDEQEYALKDGESLVETFPPTDFIKPRWAGECWVDAPTLDEWKSHRKNLIAAARYEEEVGGVDYLGVRMHTDRDSQAKYTAAVVAYQATGAFPPVWKGVSGWLAIGSAEVMLGLAAAVQQHIAALYVKEEALAGMVDAAKTREELEAVVWV